MYIEFEKIERKEMRKEDQAGIVLGCTVYTVVLVITLTMIYVFFRNW